MNEASGSLYPILYIELFVPNSSSTFFEIVFENGVSIERPGDIAGYLRNQINTQGVDKPSINIFSRFFNKKRHRVTKWESELFHTELVINGWTI